jgi:hypothetical protein
MTTKAYWFFGDTLRNGDPVPADGEWLEVSGPLVICEHGLHASMHPFDALRYARGNNLALVEIDGDIISQNDKVCARRRRIIRRIDATDMLRLFARQCALDVIHLWDAPPVVRQYLETGDETLRDAARAAAWAAAWAAARAAAGDAARDAARAAARDAARDAAWDAWAARAAAGDAARDAAWDARAAARDAQRKRFTDMVNAALGDV